MAGGSEPFTLSRGETLHFRRGDHALAHLWVVASSDCEEPGEPLVLVAFTSYKGNGRDDLTCEVDVREHSFVREMSVIAYFDAFVTTLGEVQRLHRRGDVTLREPVGPDLLARITSGFDDSPHVPQECIGLLRAQGLI